MHARQMLEQLCSIPSTQFFRRELCRIIEGHELDIYSYITVNRQLSGVGDIAQHPKIFHANISCEDWSSDPQAPMCRPGACDGSLVIPTFEQ